MGYMAYAYMGLRARVRAHVEPAMNANANAQWYCLFRVIHIHVMRCS